jgi:hypothetical protein
MEPLRFLGSHLAKFSTARLRNKRRVSRLPSKQEHAKKRTANPPPRSLNAESQQSVLDYLEVNAELSYTTVVEGLEEFLYQKELWTRA